MLESKVRATRARSRGPWLMTGGSPGGRLAVLGGAVFTGAAAGDATAGGADAPFGGEPTGAEGGGAAQAAGRDAIVRATRATADRFLWVPVCWIRLSPAQSPQTTPPDPK